MERSKLESSKEASSSDTAQQTSSGTPGSRNTTDPRGSGNASRPGGVYSPRGRGTNPRLRNSSTPRGTTSTPRSVGNRTPSESSRTPRSVGNRTPSESSRTPRSGSNTTPSESSRTPRSGSNTTPSESSRTPRSGSNTTPSESSRTPRSGSNTTPSESSRTPRSGSTIPSRISSRRGSTTTREISSRPDSASPSGIAKNLADRETASSIFSRLTDIKTASGISHSLIDNKKESKSNFREDGKTPSEKKQTIKVPEKNTSATNQRLKWNTSRSAQIPSLETCSFKPKRPDTSRINSATKSNKLASNEKANSTKRRSCTLPDAKSDTISSIKRDATPSNVVSDAAPGSVVSDAIDGGISFSVHDTEHNHPLFSDTSTIQGSVSQEMGSEMESSSDRNDITSPSSSISVSTSAEKLYGRTMNLTGSIPKDSIGDQCTAIGRSDKKTILRVGIVGSEGVGRNTLASRFMNELKVDYLYRRRNEHMEVVVVPTHHADKGPCESWWTVQSMWSSLNVIILMYAVDNRDSHQKLWDTLGPRVKFLNPDNPNVFVVGNKLDTVENSKMRRMRRNMVARALGEKKAAEMGFLCYLECSALTTEGVENIEHRIFEMAGPGIYNQQYITSQIGRSRPSVIGVLGTPGCGRNRFATALCNRTDCEGSSYEKSNFVWIGDKYEKLRVFVISTDEKADPSVLERPWWQEEYLLIILLYKIYNPQTLEVLTKWKESFRTCLEKESRKCPPLYLVGSTDIDKDFEKKVEPAQVSSDFLRTEGIAQFFECSVKNATGIDKILRAIEYEIKRWV